MGRCLENVIHYLCYYYPSTLTRTVLVKLIYLSELEFISLYQRRMTDIQFRYDNYGPFSWEIIDTAQDLIDRGILSMEKDSNILGDERYRYRALKKPDIKDLDEHSLKALQQVLEKFSAYTFSGLIDYVYSTAPMRYTHKGEVIDLKKMCNSNQLSNYEEAMIDCALREMRGEVDSGTKMANSYSDEEFDEEHKKMFLDDARNQMNFVDKEY